MSLYTLLIPPKSTCFDIGANRGGTTQALLDAGAGLVLAVEPQKAICAELQKRYFDDSRVLILQNAVSDKIGKAYMFSCFADTLATLEQDWMKGRFSSYGWKSSPEPIETVTLDYLIDFYGLPYFCSIDVEGHEPSVLRGLTHHIPLISFEYTFEYWQKHAIKCIEWLELLGDYEYNWVRGEPEPHMSESESQRFIREFMTADELIGRANNELSPGMWGNIYAREVGIVHST